MKIVFWGSSHKKHIADLLGRAGCTCIMLSDEANAVKRKVLNLCRFLSADMVYSVGGENKEELPNLGQAMEKLAKDQAYRGQLEHGAKEYAKKHLASWTRRMATEYAAVLKLTNPGQTKGIVYESR